VAENYPHIIVSGGQYPPPPHKVLMSKMVTYLQYGVMIVMFAGDWIFNKLGMAPPAIYYRMKEKQTMVIIATMMLGSNISNSLISTGAFEVYLGDKLVFSKLATGRMPTPAEIQAFLV